MSPRLSVSFCIGWLIVALATFSSAADPYMVTTGRGKYRIVEIPKVDGPFELTDDLKLAVVAGQDGFKVLSTGTGEVLGKLQRPEFSNRVAVEWKVAVDQLIIGGEKSWDVYSLPACELLHSIALPPPAPGGEFIRPPVALTIGWYCRGLFYDDQVKVKLASTRAPLYGRWSLEPNIADYLPATSASVLPFRVLMQPEFVQLENYDNIPIAAPGPGPMRYGMRWFTAQGAASMAYAGSGPGSTSGIYVELIDHDLSKYAFKTLPLWNPPSMLLDKQVDFTGWRMQALPQNVAQDRKLKTIPSATASDAIAIKLVQDLNVASLAETDAIFDLYKKDADPEFELVTGRVPQHVPFPFVVTFEDVQPLSLVVWADLTKAEILMQYCPTLMAREADERLRVETEKSREGYVEQQRKAEAIHTANAAMRKREGDRKSTFIILPIYMAMSIGFWAAAIGSVFGIISIRKRSKPEAKL